MKRLLIIYVLRKVLFYLENYRLANVKRMDMEEWNNNNNACMYIYRHLKYDLKCKKYAYYR